MMQLKRNVKQLSVPSPSKIRSRNSTICDVRIDKKVRQVEIHRSAGVPDGDMSEMDLRYEQDGLPSC